MPDDAPDSGILLDTASVSPQDPNDDGSSPLNGVPDASSDHAVAYLRSALKEGRSAGPKSEPRLLRFLHRKRKESAVGVQSTLAPQPFPIIFPELAAPGFDLAAPAPGGADETGPPALSEDPSSPEFAFSPAPLDQVDPQPDPETVPPLAAEPAEPEWSPSSASIPDEPPRAAAPDPLDPDSLDPDPIPAFEAPADDQPAPIAAHADHAVLRGEVLPPEAIHSERSGPAVEPVRVITMQPGVPRPGPDNLPNPPA